MPTTSPAVAYSYVRFSSAQQAAGDSVRRQTAKAAAWCERNDVRLDESLTLRDLGKSAFAGKHRLNPDRNALAAFLKLVEDKRIPVGSYLIVESLDRLTREDIRPSVTLLFNLIEAGIRVVQLTPVESIYDDTVEPMSLMMAIIELSRGHSESKVKSERVGAAWERKRERARKGEHILTKILPAWVEKDGDRLRLIPAKAASVKRIFRLAANGHGISAILKKLIADGVPPITGSNGWTRPHVAVILRHRHAVGEYQRRNKSGKPVGPPIPGYYPPAVTDAEYRAATVAMKKRQSRTGSINREATYINLFAGLVHNWRDGEPYYLMTGEISRDRKLYVTKASIGASGPRQSFPAPVLEHAIFSHLVELDPASVVGSNDARSELLDAQDELTAIQQRIGELKAELARGGPVSAVVDVLRQLEADERAASGRVESLRDSAAMPLTVAFKNVTDLICAMDPSKADVRNTRIRLRSVLRRIIDRIDLLVFPHGRIRCAFVKVRFVSGGVRVYAVMMKPPYGNGTIRKPGAWYARSFGGRDSNLLDVTISDPTPPQPDTRGYLPGLAPKKKKKQKAKAEPTPTPVGPGIMDPAFVPDETFAKKFVAYTTDLKHSTTGELP